MVARYSFRKLLTEEFPEKDGVFVEYCTNIAHDIYEQTRTTGESIVILGNSVGCLFAYQCAALLERRGKTPLSLILFNLNFISNFIFSTKKDTFSVISFSSSIFCVEFGSILYGLPSTSKEIALSVGLSTITILFCLEQENNTVARPNDKNIFFIIFYLCKGKKHALYTKEVTKLSLYLPFS